MVGAAASWKLYADDSVNKKSSVGTRPSLDAGACSACESSDVIPGGLWSVDGSEVVKFGEKPVLSCSAGCVMIRAASGAAAVRCKGRSCCDAVGSCVSTVRSVGGEGKVLCLKRCQI